MVSPTSAQEPGEQTTVWQLMCTTELSSCDSFRRFSKLIAQLFISQLTFSDGQVRDLLEEMGTYLGGHLAILDNVSSTGSC